MTDNTSGTRQPDAALQALDRLVGTWRLSGDAIGSVTYRWMEGGFFLVQEGELELYGHHSKFTEIIGHERSFGGEPSTDIMSRTYTAEGDTLDYVYELDGDTLTIWGGHRDSDSHYTGTFSADGNTLSGAWSWPGGGYKATSTRQPGTAPSYEGRVNAMETVVSADGTKIAFDRHGRGDAGTALLIGGAFSYRAFPKMVKLAETLANDHALTVINYDRRGRGDSGDTPGVYDVEHEIDDLAALVKAAGGSASLFGWSSGAGLALRAAASGRIAGIERVVAFEPPFVVDREHHVPPAGLGQTLHELVAADRRSQTVQFYMTKAMGIPGVFVALMRVLPIWSKLKATASSTPHDWAVMGEFMRGEPLRPGDWAGVTVPTLVLAGGKSEPLLRKAARAIADVLPNAEHRELPKLSHNPNVQLLAPAAAEFLGKHHETN